MAPDGNISISPDVYSRFLRFKNQLVMAQRMIKKLIEYSDGSDDTSRIRDLNSESTALKYEFGDLISQINQFLSDFLHLNPREVSIALQDLDKKDKLDALISEIQGYRNIVEEIEDKVRSALRNLTGISENYSRILDIRLRLKILEEHLELQIPRLNHLEDEDEMERLEAEIDACMAEVEKFVEKLLKFAKKFLLEELDFLRKALERLRKAESSEVCKAEISDIRKRFGEFGNAVFRSSDEDDLDPSVDAFCEKTGEFNKELNEIGDKVFMTGIELVPSSGTSASDFEELRQGLEVEQPMNPVELGADDFDDQNLDETKEDEPNLERDLLQQNRIDLSSDSGDEPNVDEPDSGDRNLGEADVEGDQLEQNYIDLSDGSGDENLSEDDELNVDDQEGVNSSTDEDLGIIDPLEEFPFLKTGKEKRLF